jgi:hypothetical protein
MGLKEELADWIGELKKTGEIKDEEIATLETILGKEKVLPVLRKSVLATSEFSKQMDKLKKEYDEKVAAEDTFHTDVATWKKGAQEKLNRAIQERQSLEASIRTLAEQNDADPEKDWGIKLSRTSESDSERTRRSTVTRRDTSNNGDGDDDNRGAFDSKVLDGLANDIRQSPRFTAALADIQAEHFELFGKPLKGTTQIVDRAIKERKSIREIWEQENKVPDRRAELDKTQREAHDKEVGDAAVTRYVSEHAVDPSMTPTRTRSESGSPMLNQFYANKKPNEQKPEERSVSGAIEAFRSGKYRDQAKRGT